MSAGNDPYPEGSTLCELDRAAGARKGTAFRCFKRLLSTLQEGTDYLVFHHRHDGERLASLHRQGRVYANSLNIVMLAPHAARAVADAMRDEAGATR